MGYPPRLLVAARLASVSALSMSSSCGVASGERGLRGCVIGAGAAGLSSARVLRDAGFHVDVFEKAPQLGGVWRYEQPEATNPVLYKGLTTNLPKEVMQYASLPFDQTLPSFLSANDVLDYLQEYATRFNLEPLIHFDRKVTSVSPLFDNHGSTTSTVGGFEPGEGPLPRWRVRHSASRHTSSANVLKVSEEDEEEEEEYDVVVVANGHYESPHVPPEWQEMALRGGVRVMHSKDYDQPEPFTGKRVVVVGSRASGTDLAREIATVADLVLVVDRSLPPPKIGDSGEVGKSAARVGGSRDNIVRVPRLYDLGTGSGENDVGGTTCATATIGDYAGLGLEATLRRALGHRDSGDQVVEGEVEPPGNGDDDAGVERVAVGIHDVVWCTGFNYEFPFLEGQLDFDGQPLVSAKDRRVDPLYLQLFHAKYPSLAFVGIPHSVVPFPLHEFQSTLLAKVWSGDAPSLPPLKDRLAWVEELYAAQGDAKNTHQLGDKQWNYCFNLLKQASIDPARTPVADFGKATRLKPDNGSSEIANGINIDGAGGADKSEDTTRFNSESLEDFIARSKAIYDDSSKARPAFPGAPDTYRQRRYTVTGPRSWKVVESSSAS